MINFKKRFYNPAFWTGVISIILLVFSSAGLNFNDFTSWGALWEGIKAVISNPVAILSIIGALAGVTADTSTKGFLDDGRKN